MKYKFNPVRAVFEFWGMIVILTVFVIILLLGCKDSGGGQFVATSLQPDPAPEADSFYMDESTCGEQTQLVIDEFIADEIIDVDADQYFCSFAASTAALVTAGWSDDIDGTMQFFKDKIYPGLYPFLVMRYYFNDFLQIAGDRPPQFEIFNRNPEGFIDDIMQALQDGRTVVLPVRREKEYGVSSQGHVLNVYGWQELEDGSINLWVTDPSDDTQRAELVSVKWFCKERRWYLGCEFPNWYIHSVITLEPPEV